MGEPLWEDGGWQPLPRLDDGVTADVPVTHRWAASVGYTASGLPRLGEVRDRVWAAGGYCGTGNVVGALCGRGAAARALGKDSPATAFGGPTPRAAAEDGTRETL